MEGGPWMIVKGGFVHGLCSADRPRITQTFGTLHFQRVPKQGEREHKHWWRVYILEHVRPVVFVQLLY